MDRAGACRRGPLLGIRARDLHRGRCPVHADACRSVDHARHRTSSLDPRRNQRAIRCLACIEVCTVLFHVLDVQRPDVTCRADRCVWRYDAIVRQYRRIIGVERRAKHLRGVDREVCIRKMTAFTVIQPSRINEVE